MNNYETRVCYLNSDMYISVPAGAPPQPEIEEITADTVTLAWEKPEDDGGGKIKGYIVEKKGPDGKWVEATTVPIKDTKFTVPNLKTGDDYQFRVKAVNAAGPGEESRPTGVVKVETQPGIDLH